MFFKRTKRDKRKTAVFKNNDQKDEGLPLLSLAPRYQEKNHKIYVDAINNALNDPDNDNRNIALTGSYGTGKSSILDGVVRSQELKVEKEWPWRKRLLRKFHGKRKPRFPVMRLSLAALGLSGVFPAVVASENDSNGTRSDTTTNRIQKEIIKQLLYSEHPAGLLCSRFSRLSRKKFWHVLLYSLFTGTVSTILSFSLGGLDRMSMLLGSNEWLTLGATLFLTTILGLIFFYFVYDKLFNSSKISRISAPGAGSIALAENSSAFFDQYLDEIIYFFEVTQCTVVIFEDIDRFEDPYIFETLRALNSQLNSAQQLGSNSIHFIYAIKDSALCDIKAMDEPQPTSAQKKEQDRAITNRVKFFDVIIPVVPFLTFSNARELLAGEEVINTHVSSELIKMSASSLTDMRLIKNIRNEFLIFRERVIKLDEEKEHDDKVFAMVLYKNRNLIDFEEMVRGEGRIDKIYKAFRDIVNQNLKDQRLQRRKVLEKLRSSENEEDEEAELKKIMEALDEKISFLEDSGLRMADLWDKDFTVLKEREEHEGKSFSEIVLGYFGDEVETRLIQRGYINENYMFYSAIYPDNRFSIPARRFLIHQVGRGEMDPNFSLRTEDVKAILEECVASDLGNPGLFNVDIIDYLLEKERDSWLKYFFNALSGKFKEQAQDFLNSYFNGEKGGHPEKLIQKLTPAWTGTLDFIISQLDTEIKLSLLGVALKNLSTDINYIVTDELAQQLKENYRELKAFTSDSTSAGTAVQLADLLERGEVLLESLSELGAKVNETVIAKSLYTVTRSNLEQAVEGRSESLALDHVRRNAPTVYAHILNNIHGYLEAIQEDATIDSNELFIQIINDVYEAAEEEERQRIVAEVISGANRQCCVEDLGLAPAEIWTVLVQNKRVKVDFNNVKAYVDEINEIDDALATLLQNNDYAVNDLADAVEEDKRKIAVMVLQAKQVLPEPSQRVKLVENFELENWLAVESVPIEEGKLFGLLIEKDIIPDASKSFEAIKNCSWETREFFISKSKKFANEDYAKPEYIKQDEIIQALLSQIIPNDIKIGIINMLPEYEGVGAEELEEIAGCVLEGTALRSLTEPGMKYFAASSINKELKVKLLAQSLSQPENDKSFNKTLSKILQFIGGRYADIAIRNGRKIKIPNTTDNETIIKKLKAINIVSSSSVKGGNIQVNMKRC